MTKINTNKNITLKLEQEATNLRKNFLKSIENNELIQRLKQCSDTIADGSNANDKSSIDENIKHLFLFQKMKNCMNFYEITKCLKT